MDEELKNLRNRIDEIDGEIINLIEARVELAKKIRDVKKKEGLEIEDRKREMEVLERVSDNTPLDREFVKKLFKSLIDYCKNEQRK